MQGKFKSLTFSLSDDPEICCWSKELHSNTLSSMTVPSPSGAGVAGPSDATMCNLASTMGSLKDVFLKKCNSQIRKEKQV